MYPRQVTETIVQDWAHGLSAEESREHITDKHKITPCLNTIYTHRHSLTAQNLIDELLRQQERAILKQDTDNPDLAMKYRNELLKILLPQRIESETKIISKQIEEKRNVTIVADYTRAIEAAVDADVAVLRTRKQMDTETVTPNNGA